MYRICVSCCFQGSGGPAGTGQGVGAVGWILPGRGVLPEGEGRLQHCPDGEVLDEGKGCIYMRSSQHKYGSFYCLKVNHKTVFVSWLIIKDAGAQPRGRHTTKDLLATESYIYFSISPVFFFLLNQLIIFSPQVLIEIKLFHLIIYRQPVTMGHK